MISHVTASLVVELEKALQLAYDFGLFGLVERHTEFLPASGVAHCFCCKVLLVECPLSERIAKEGARRGTLLWTRAIWLGIQWVLPF